MTFKIRRRTDDLWILEGKPILFGKWRQVGTIWLDPRTKQYNATRGAGLRRRRGIFTSLNEARSWLER